MISTVIAPRALEATKHAIEQLRVALACDKN
jgi:hypothetical protein